MQKLVKKIRLLVNNPIFKMVGYILCIVALIIFIKELNSYATIKEALLSVINNDATVSIFAVGIFTLLLRAVTYWLDSMLEEENKTESNHRLIIRQYNGHKNTLLSTFNRSGAFLKIYAPNLETERYVKNYEKDKYSKNYAAYERELEASGFPRIKNGQKTEARPDAALTLSSLSIYANNKNNPLNEIVITDIDRRYPLPKYIQYNSQDLLKAHSTTSFKRNEATIRLSDIDYSNNRLHLFTERSTYYEMLMTNRCMDFEYQPNMTLRQIYEYAETITDIAESKLSNQIGINGLISTSDGYLLVEKRDRSKSTWKDKFSQPISLAMKKKDIKEHLEKAELNNNDVSDIFLSIIDKTLLSNYGVSIKNGDYTFDIKQNFLGLARDLLEGGKPNLYFAVTLNIDAKTLKSRMEEMASKKADIEKNISQLENSKLKSHFYLIKKEEVKIDYNYIMTLKRKGRNRDWYHVNRIKRPRSNIVKCTLNSARHFFYWIFQSTYQRECSEAFMVSIAYMQIFDSDVSIKKETEERKVEIGDNMKKAVALGEILLRLTPQNNALIKNVNGFDAYFGGSESNVLILLSSLGHRTECLTALPDNSLGTAVEQHLHKYNVSTDFVIKNGDVLGTYYLEQGFADRASSVIYNRKSSEITKLNAESFSDTQLDLIFEDCSLFYISGITFGLSKGCRNLSHRMIDEAHKRGIPVGFDCNYRAKVWGKYPAEEYNKILYKCEFIFCAEEDLNACGITDPSSLFKNGNCKYLIKRKREILSNSRQRACCSVTVFEDGKLTEYKSEEKEFEVMGKIGTGDAFCAGMLHCLFKSEVDIPYAMEFALACLRLKHTVIGDVLTFSEKEIINFLENEKSKKGLIR
ncbi:MAG: sugar kinase [Acutalibacteraceae bacterium]|nr:sugar kinase [Acutalibacteraceae bacterium]